MMKGWKQTSRLLVAVFLAVVLAPHIAFAEYNSSNYSTNESFFGSGGALDNSSTNYKAKSSLGDFADGSVSGSAYSAQGGFNTDTTPFLEFVVNSATIDLGNVTTGSAGTGTGTFTVKAYLSDGYVVRNASPPPANGAYTMTGLASPTASSPGTQQFGINLVANTSPTTFGANPVQVPDSTFSFGTAATGYGTTNNFKYVNGDVIAQSTKSSGETDFTVSYMMNISTTTPGGTYVMNHIMVATATY